MKRGDLVTLACVPAFIFLAASQLQAQWVKAPTPGVPRTADGKPNLRGPAPRTADGKPDLSGMWQSNFKFNTNLAADLKPDAVPLTAWGQALYAERQGNNSKDDPEAYCLPAGVPRATAAGGLPSRIVQTSNLIVILQESKTMFREIFLDDRKLQTDPQPTWMGYSTGTWEGDVLVVRTTGFNEQTWLDDVGHPHSESLRVTERYRRPDFGHLFIDITVEDQKAYSRPWTVTEDLRLDPEGDLIEYICNENERDVRHLVGK